MADSAELRLAGTAPQDPDVKNDKDPPAVDAIIPGDTDGLLDALKIRTQFIVEIPEWEENTLPFAEVVSLYWAREETPEEKIKLEEREVPPGSTFPLKVVVERREYQQGRMRLTYSGYNSSGNAFASQPLLVTVDTIAPYSGASPLEPTVVGNADVITDDYLSQNGDTFTLTIPDYADRAPGDMAFFYWIKDVPKEPEQLPVPTLPAIDMAGARTAVLTKAMLAEIGDGQCYGVYILRDKAGNTSPISYWYAATVALGLLPDNLKVPEVPAANDGMVNREDGHLGVEVHIPAFDNAKNGDLVYAKWGVTNLPVYPTGPNPDFPLRIAVPWQAMVDNYQFNTGTPDQEVTISYHVERVGLRFPDPPLTSEVTVWLDVVGPENPDPDPVNPDLPKLTVKGESGQDNTLIDTDNGKDATVTFLLYEGAKQGDRIHLVWKGVPAADFHTVGAEVPGDTITMAVPWSLIQGGGNGLQVPVCYRITDENGVNYQQSPATPVNVSAIIIVLPPPTFPDLGQTPTGEPILNCSSIKKLNDVHGIRVHVPPSEHLKAGMDITFDWFVAKDNQGAELIDSTGFNERVRISPDQERVGVDWFIRPYAEKVLPAFEDTETRFGYSWLKYSVAINEIPMTTDEVVEMIGLNVGPGESCNLDDIP
ncbi:hypothetical protein ACX3YG_18300 [Pseudomonas wadenswilerensis]